jgi:hypothetical protein
MHTHQQRTCPEDNAEGNDTAGARRQRGQQLSHDRVVLAKVPCRGVR